MANSFNASAQFNFSNISSYGAILIPLEEEEKEQDKNIKQKNNLKNKLSSAFKNTGTTIKQGFKNATQELKSAANELLGGDSTAMTSLISKFSGIAVAQAILDGKVSSQEALDYLFMGFAPALGVQGSLMGYSGLNQLKDALKSGSINVGAFVNGLTRTIKGGRQLAKDVVNKQSNYNIIEIDLTVSHSESYQSETPDRRVQNGQSLNEYIHNMPITYNVQCALQDNKRYSAGELKRIIQEIRRTKKVVSLILGEEKYDNLVLTDFTPNSDCTKSGMDYTLAFKKITWSEIETNAQVTIQKIPIVDTEDTLNLSTGSLGGVSSGDIKMPTIKDFANESGLTDFAKQKAEKYESTLSILYRTITGKE